MKNLLTKIFLTSLISSILLLNIYAQKKEISKSFDTKKKVEVNTALGGIILQQSNDGKIHVNIVHNYDKGEFEAKFKEKGDRLLIEEELDLDDSDGKSSKWTISVPIKTEIELSSGTGSISIEDLDASIEGSTGTGRINISNCDGDIELSSGTGSVMVEKCNGDFEVSSGTGTVKVKNCDGDFEVSSGTGKLKLQILKDLLMQAAAPVTAKLIM